MEGDLLLLRREMLRNWRVWVERIAGAARRILPDARVYVIGSVARGDYIAASDVDVLIVSSYTPRTPRERARVKARIEEELGLPYYHPFEIHLATPSEAQLYLKRAQGSVVEISTR